MTNPKATPIPPDDGSYTAHHTQRPGEMALHGPDGELVAIIVLSSQGAEFFAEHQRRIVAATIDRLAGNDGPALASFFARRQHLLRHKTYRHKDQP